eukprot:TRINITY_DN23324_c0_g1_i1.p1 TRINITY_DN23324_c0_g1~~TRINITY_DN23324_c0_g1_i1.p1  ORF type:complete len:346 (+),score=54.69 TRINITY_DN23324_c0_g1_i1:169-1206(+)
MAVLSATLHPGPPMELDATLSPKLQPRPELATDRSEDIADAVSSACSTDATAPVPAVSTCNEDPLEELPESSHLDNESLVLHNTFLDFGRREPMFSRRRAYSDWSGAQARQEAGLEAACLEELTAPLPETMYQGGWDQAEAMAYEQWQWQESSSYDCTGCYWQMRPEECWAIQSAAMRPAEPELPRDKPVFKPKWYYGNAWPFNTAPTTLLLSNLPSELTQLDLLSVLDKLGFSSYYDFVFLPTDLKTGRHQGPAIVNLTRHSIAVTLATHMHEFSEWGVGDASLQCCAKWSLPKQGLVELVEAHRNHLAMQDGVPDARRPMMFMNGWPAVFPEPTAPPQSRRRS